MLHFDFTFPSNPEDEGCYNAQEDLNTILDAPNPIFSYVSQRILNDERYLDAGGTVGDVRQVFLEFYERADRTVPAYFPKEPANRKYNIGKRKWKQAYERSDVTFGRREDRLVAEFDLEPHELYSYRKTLPMKMRPEKSGRSIIIKNPDGFEAWIDLTELGDNDETESAGLLSRLLN